MSLQERFEQATVDVKRLNNASNSEKLEFYGLFKQASGETFDASKRKNIGMLDIAGKAKHDAWGKVSELSVEEAQEKYIELFEQLKAKYGLKEEEEK